MTFSDTEGTRSKEKESSHMQRQTCLEQEIKNVSSLVGKLSSSIEDNAMERKKERQRSLSPVAGYTPGYKSPPRYMPQYRSQSPAQTYNNVRSPPQSVNLRPDWNSPNRRQQFSPNRSDYQSPNFGYQSPNFRDQGRGQGQYQGKNKGFTPSSERSFRGSPQNQYSQTTTFGQNKKTIYPLKAVQEQNASVSQLFPRKEHLNGKGSVQVAHIWSRMKEAN